MRFQGTMSELRQKRNRALALVLRTSDDGKALRILADQGLSARVDDGKVVMPQASDGEIAAVNRYLVGHGLDVYELQVARIDLETIFMDLIEGRS